MTTTKSDELMAAYPAIDDLTSFGARVLEWFEREGRHDLPWQYHQHSSADIYAVWLSEIMLQQTQVATVLGYYERFLQRFGTVEALASADWQEIAPYWAGAWLLCTRPKSSCRRQTSGGIYPSKPSISSDGG